MLKDVCHAIVEFIKPITNLKSIFDFFITTTWRDRHSHLKGLLPKLQMTLEKYTCLIYNRNKEGFFLLFNLKHVEICSSPTF